jgi:hypothetical protein
MLANDDGAGELTAKAWISRRVVAKISSKEIEMEKEDLNKVEDGLAPAYN